MNEHHIRVARTARYHTLGPIDADEVWFVCHGYAQLARFFLRAFEPIDDGSRFIVAPEALNRYYFETAPGVHVSDARVAATWMTREDRVHEIGDYVAYLDALAAHVAAARVPGAPHVARVVALGFSQGAATVSRWAVLGSTRLDHVVLWGAGVAHDLDLHATAFRGAALTLATGRADPYVDETRVARERERLERAGVAHELFRHDGGHAIPRAAITDLASALRG